MSISLSGRFPEETFQTPCDLINSLHDTRVSKIYEVVHCNFFRSSRSPECPFLYISKSSEGKSYDSMRPDQ